MIKRRPRGEAADLILRAIAECDGDMSLSVLRERTGLPAPTLRDNIYNLEREGQIETFRDDVGKLWIAKPA
jgi:uncharacterized membrane protein